MFGFSLSEILIVAVVALVVVGPRQMPLMMRTAGQWLGKLRRMAFDMRAQSGIDEILRMEGLEKDIRQLQSLVRGNVLGALDDGHFDLDHVARPHQGAMSTGEDLFDNEYPAIGCDSFDAIAEDLDPYLGSSMGVAGLQEECATDSHKISETRSDG